MPTTLDRRPPVILLGGGANALSIARNLGRRGVRVYALNDHSSHVRYSRFARYLPARWLGGDEATWKAFLLGPDSDALRGAVLISPSDVGIEIIAHNRERLAEKFILDDSNPDAQLAMLDKLRTYEAARAGGVDTPRFWRVETLQDVLRLEGELVYPLLVKPLHSHLFWEHFGGKKFLTVSDFGELTAAFRAVRGAGVAAMLVERIPGPDDRLCSYYTYLDENSQPLWHFTKRIIRRYPVNMGEASYHVTDWNPAVRDAALRLFQHARLRGLANAEFKRDGRDGRLKLIECNARFTAADCLVAASGIDLASFVYNRLTGLPLPPTDQYRTGLRLWNPGRDYKAYRELRAKKQITLTGWLRSIRPPLVFPYFRWDDPMPTIVDALRAVGVDRVYAAVRRLLGRVWGWFRARRPEAEAAGPLPPVASRP